MTSYASMIPDESPEERSERQCRWNEFVDTFGSKAVMDSWEAARERERRRCITMCKLAVKAAMLQGDMERETAVKLVAHLDYGDGSFGDWMAERWLGLDHVQRPYVRRQPREWYHVEYY